MVHCLCKVLGWLEVAEVHPNKLHGHDVVLGQWRAGVQQANQVPMELLLEVPVGAFASSPPPNHLRQLWGKGDMAGVVPHY